MRREHETQVDAIHLIGDAAEINGELKAFNLRVYAGDSQFDLAPTFKAHDMQYYKWLEGYFLEKAQIKLEMESA